MLRIRSLLLPTVIAVGTAFMPDAQAAVVLAGAGRTTTVAVGSTTPATLLTVTVNLRSRLNRCVVTASADASLEDAHLIATELQFGFGVDNDILLEPASIRSVQLIENASIIDPGVAVAATTFAFDDLPRGTHEFRFLARKALPSVADGAVPSASMTVLCDRQTAMTN